MEHTVHIIKSNKRLIPSLLNVFPMFELRLIGDRDKLEAISIRCINCKKETGLYLRTSTLHHLGMLWIICSNKKITYEMDKSNHPNWLNKGPWYNISICSRLHGSLFEYFITHARTDKYNLMCSIVANDEKQPSYEDEEISIGDRLIPKHVTTESLEALGATLNFV